MVIREAFDKICDRLAPKPATPAENLKKLSKATIFGTLGTMVAIAFVIGCLATGDHGAILGFYSTLGALAAGGTILAALQRRGYQRQHPELTGPETKYRFRDFSEEVESAFRNIFTSFAFTSPSFWRRDIAVIEMEKSD